MADLKDALAANAEAIARTLDGVLPPVEGAAARVAEAMRYAALNGGKRLRPFLAVSAARLFDVPEVSALRGGAAVELIHCYSLVHDDLPAMDDDELRRGLPTCHMKFDEATAILAGDGLLTLAFEVLADPATHADAEVRCALAHGLALAAGARGMVGGQMIDLLAEGRRLDLAHTTQLQSLKTGALIAFSCETGAILGRAGDEARAALRGYGEDLGLAFQIADDLLDIEGSVEEMGKAVGKDADAGKATFVDFLGVDGARARARELVDQAVARLDRFGNGAGLLRQVALYVVERRS